MGIAANNLGIVGYPTSLQELFSPDWMERYIESYSYWYYDEYGNYVESDDQWSIILPRIVGQENFDGVFGEDDGIIDPKETRNVLGLIISVSHNKKFDRPRSGVYRM